jgi:hypothetical protein
MPLWFLIVGGVLAFIAGRSSSAPPAPSIGRALPAPPAPSRAIKRVGEKVTFELGVPYAIVATTVVPSAELARLEQLLELGTWHARRVLFRQQGGTTTVSLCFVAPKTASVPIGQPLDWDLGDGRFRLILREVRRLDGRSC